MSDSPGTYAIAASPHVDPELLLAAVASPAFERWTSRLAADLDLRSVRVRDVVAFGARVGFVLAEAEVYDAEGRRLPGVAFLRGDSVAVLLTVTDAAGRVLVVLTRQARTAVGASAFHEIPAGMLDGGAFASKAIEELSEEIGADVALREEDLVEIAECHPSPGGCDEAVRIFAAELRGLDPALVDSLEGRATGNAGEGEAIAVVLAEPARARELAGRDMKSLVALDWLERRRT